MTDAFHLVRFIEAQVQTYSVALDELKAGCKRTHWMWFVFPQIAGLGHSPTARHFAVGGLAEATDYLAHPLLGRRLIDATEVVNALEGLTARDIFGSPDDLKFRSSMTLFAQVADAHPCFQQALDRSFAGKADSMTLTILATLRTSGAQRKRHI